MNHDDMVEYLRRCYELASKSPDPSNQNGAIITNCVGSYGKMDGVQGLNRFRESLVYDPKQLLDRDWKIRNIVHAEEYAVFEAARIGLKCEGATMVCPWAPCTQCGKAIIMSGIKELVVHKSRMEQTPPRWYTDVQMALNDLKEHKVHITWVDQVLDATPVLVNGVIWRP